MTVNDRERTSRTNTRRDFLQATGKAAAISALAAGIAPHAYAAGDSTIRLALIGCGGRGTGAIANALSRSGGPVKLVAMADIFPRALAVSHAALTRRFKDQVDVPEDRRFIGFDAFQKAIDLLGPGDVASLTTPPAFRPQHFEYAVSRGVNVFMEKTFACDPPGTRRLLKSADQSEKMNLKVAVGFMWRHSLARQEVIQRIHDGAIGDVNLLRCYRMHGPMRCPRRDPKDNELLFQIDHHRCFPWASSGLYGDWHSHNIDVACWAKGAWPVSAQALGGRTFTNIGPQFDHYTVEYNFADGARLLVFTRGADRCYGTYSDYAHGTKGSAVLMTSLAQPYTKLYNSQKMAKENLVWEFGRKDPDPYDAEWQVLLDAIRSGAKHNEARRAAEANFATLMGQIAAHSGQWVTWEQTVNSDFQYVENLDAITADSPAPIQADADGVYPAPIPGVTQVL